MMQRQQQEHPAVDLLIRQRALADGHCAGGLAIDHQRTADRAADLVKRDQRGGQPHRAADAQAFCLAARGVGVVRGVIFHHQRLGLAGHGDFIQTAIKAVIDLDDGGGAWPADQSLPPHIFSDLLRSRCRHG